MESGCTHCGLCLESCPTYTLWGREPDSPRGRIVMIEAALADAGSVSGPMIAHLDACAGCMACVSVCPEDVQYGDLLNLGRAAIERKRPVAERVRRRARVAAQARSGRLRTLSGTDGVEHFTPAQGETRGRVGLLLGCSGRASFDALNVATAALLSAEGYDVIAPSRPDCCGATALAFGEPRTAHRRAQDTIAAFAAIGGVDHIVVNAGTCGAAMKNYGRLLGTAQARAFSALVVDVHELLVREPTRLTLTPLALRVAVHDACQLKHGQGISAAVRELLRRIPGVELLELPAAAGACCGGGGAYRASAPQASVELGDRQARAIVQAGAQAIVSGDHACLRQLTERLRAGGHEIPVRHPLELLHRALAATLEPASSEASQ